MEQIIDPKTESPTELVLKISDEFETPPPPRIKGKTKPSSPPVFQKFLIPEPPKINTTSFPVIISRIMLKSHIPPEVGPNIKKSDFEQLLCFLCLDKPTNKKRVYHIFFSTEKDLKMDSAVVQKIYENRTDFKIITVEYVETLCARSLHRRVQKSFTDVVWNKQGNVFETEMKGPKDVKRIIHRVFALDNEEVEKLFNYAKFLSATNS